MKIVKAFPPNFEQIKEVFDLKGFTPVFAYGSTLYNPSGHEISDHLMVHEETHEKQQKPIGADIWWFKYLTDIDFRLSQEVEAYSNQYKFVRKYLGRDIGRQFLKDLAKDLSSKMYGSIVSKEHARILIQNYGN